MAISRQISIVPAAAANNNIALSQSPGAGAITLNGSLVSGGVATLDIARRVGLGSGGVDTGITFTVIGTNRFGGALSETVTGAGAGGTAITTQDFKTVTSVTHTGSVAGTLVIGTLAATSSASSEWVVLDTASDPMNMGIAVVVSGTINYTVEYTYDDPSNPFTATFPTVFNITSGSLTAKAATGDSQANKFDWPIFAVRLTVNSYTTGGSAKMIVIQAGIGQ